jgi:hypothetical protein
MLCGLPLAIIAIMVSDHDDEPAYAALLRPSVPALTEDSLRAANLS